MTGGAGGPQYWRVRVRDVGVALHPRQRIVEILTRDGEVETIVHETAVENSSIEIGFPVGAREDAYLIELPDEVMSGGPQFGARRVWVAHSEIVRP